MNILISDQEMRQAAEVIRMDAGLGVDALIAQDLGVVNLCRQVAPGVPIRASTQMSIHSLAGVLQAAELCVSRVVLARELPPTLWPRPLWGFCLNIFNSRAMHYLREQKLESQLVSSEMTLPQLRDLSQAVPVEVLVYGRLPLMLMENCVIKNRTGACSCDSPAELIDRMGEEFPLLRDPDTCRNVL